MNKFESDIDEFKKTFAADLAFDAGQLPNDGDIYAYAIEVPEDLANLYVCSAVARTSRFNARWNGVTDLVWWESILGYFDDKYISPEWEYETTKASFTESQRQLERIQQEHFTPYLIETESEELRYRNLIYTAILDVMTNGLPSNPKLLYLIILSDDEHKIERASFNRLNSGAIKRRLWLRYNVHVCAYIPIAFLNNFFGKFLPR